MTVPPGTTSTRCSPRPLRLVHEPDPADRLDQRGPDLRVEPVQRAGQRVGGHPQLGELDAVEAERRLPDRGGAALPDRLDDRPDRVRRRLHVDRGAREHAGQAARRRAGR